MKNSLANQFVKNKNGHWCRFYKVLEMADSEILEMMEDDANGMLWVWSNQEFFENYAVLHKIVHGVEFDPWVNDY